MLCFRKLWGYVIILKSFYVLERVSVAERRISMQNVSVVNIIDMIISCERYVEVSLFTCHFSVNKIWIGPD